MKLNFLPENSRQFFTLVGSSQDKALLGIVAPS
jgi:hypothetical protein